MKRGVRMHGWARGLRMLSILLNVRFASRAAVALALNLALPSAVFAEGASISGLWDIALDGGPHRCRLSLRPEHSDRGDHFMVLAPACRRLMPILTKAGRWTSDADRVTFKEPSGSPVIDFARDGSGFKAVTPDGATYRMTMVAAIGRDAAGPETEGLPQPETPPVIHLAATKRVATERPSELAGRYAILREKGRDTGCMLTLDDKTRVRGGDRAALAPACRDQGIVVFDPVAWQIVNGRLVLTAKAGHVTHLDKQEDGTWLKDPSEGKSLSLKKL
jgi:hypothetical protein